jgi:hypothetical protein
MLDYKTTFGKFSDTNTKHNLNAEPICINKQELSRNVYMKFNVLRQRTPTGSRYQKI